LKQVEVGFHKLDGQEIAASHADRCDNGKKRIVVAKGIIRVAKQFSFILGRGYRPRRR